MELTEENKRLVAERLTTSVPYTIRDAERCYAESLEIIKSRTAMRGDNWRASGLLGAFLEIHQLYYRLRTLIWLVESPPKNYEEHSKWYGQILDALQDIRNFSVFGEISLKEGNFKGEKYE